MGRNHTPLHICEFPVRNSEFGVLNSKLPLPNSKFAVPNPKLPLPNSKFGVLNSKFPLLNSEFAVLSFKLPPLDSEFVVPNCEFEVIWLVGLGGDFCFVCVAFFAGETSF